MVDWWLKQQRVRISGFYSKLSVLLLCIMLVFWHIFSSFHSPVKQLEADRFQGEHLDFSAAQTGGTQRQVTRGVEQ